MVLLIFGLLVQAKFIKYQHTGLFYLPLQESRDKGVFKNQIKRPIPYYKFLVEYKRVKDQLPNVNFGKLLSYFIVTL